MDNEKIDHIIELLNRLSDEERVEVFSKFCRYCGDKNPDCQCWNDD
jgi:hypothetical protein